ncbi:MAG: hypothetical protein KDD28_22580 [Phaeodactylibacter sp.]|nr:hypothetical protein [Phaeodactylibacter sp.]
MTTATTDTTTGPRAKIVTLEFTGRTVYCFPVALPIKLKAKRKTTTT